jgi:Ig-like domain from next to BRCA1 gene
MGKGGNSMKKIFSLALSALVPVLLLSACGGATTPAGGAGAANTAAAQTVFAAQTAAGAVTATSVPSLTPELQLSPTLTPTGFPTAAVTRPAVTQASTCDGATYVSDVTIPDGTVIAPGGSFIKTWSIRNSGTCDWSTSYALAYLSGSKMDGSTTKLSAAVAVGNPVNISVGMYAPLSPGTYIGYWRMQNAAGTFFGDQVFVKIVVANGTVTVSVTPTKSGTGLARTATPTPTATGSGPSLTSTPTTPPVNTATSTAAPTNTATPDTPTVTPV